jgi:hypothetical protein
VPEVINRLAVRGEGEEEEKRRREMSSERWDRKAIRIDAQAYTKSERGKRIDPYDFAFESC